MNSGALDVAFTVRPDGRYSGMMGSEPVRELAPGEKLSIAVEARPSPNAHLVVSVRVESLASGPMPASLYAIHWQSRHPMDTLMANKVVAAPDLYGRPVFTASIGEGEGSVVVSIRCHVPEEASQRQAPTS